MSAFASTRARLSCACFAGLVSLALGGAAASPPDFASNEAAWLHPPGGEFPDVAGSPTPMHQDPAHPYVGNNNAGKQPTYRIGDTAHPNLKQWAKDVMAKDNAEVLKGKIAFTARSSCMPGGVPVFMLFGGQPIYFIQTPKKIWMIYEGDHQIRHVYMDATHSANPKPTWYGESIGRYDGDALVIDTIGMNNKTVIDAYRTPHTEKLHVVERWRLMDGGKTLHVDITVDDPDTFEKPWSTFQTYTRGEQTLQEEVCAENNQHLFDYHIPEAKTPDF
jgi:hypothetical protein